MITHTFPPHIKTLSQFNAEIIRAQTAAHGEDYCAIHGAIRRLGAGLRTYTELGVKQGGTASTALLNSFRRIILVDIDLKPYNAFLRPIAEQYAKSFEIDLLAHETDSRRHDARDYLSVDMLVIDSVHTPRQIKKELEVHGPNVNRYILVHDTTAVPSTYDALMEWAVPRGWREVERGQTNVGYTAIAKR